MKKLTGIDIKKMGTVRRAHTDKKAVIGKDGNDAKKSVFYSLSLKDYNRGAVRSINKEEAYDILGSIQAYAADDGVLSDEEMRKMFTDWGYLSDESETDEEWLKKKPETFTDEEWLAEKSKRSSAEWYQKGVEEFDKFIEKEYEMDSTRVEVNADASAEQIAEDKVTLGEKKQVLKDMQANFPADSPVSAMINEALAANNMEALDSISTQLNDYIKTESEKLPDDITGTPQSTKKGEKRDLGLIVTSEKDADGHILYQGKMTASSSYGHMAFVYPDVNQSIAMQAFVKANPDYFDTSKTYSAQQVAGVMQNNQGKVFNYPDLSDPAQVEGKQNVLNAQDVLSTIDGIRSLDTSVMSTATTDVAPEVAAAQLGAGEETALTEEAQAEAVSAVTTQKAAEVTGRIQTVLSEDNTEENSRLETVKDLLRKDKTVSYTSMRNAEGGVQGFLAQLDSEFTGTNAQELAAVIISNDTPQDIKLEVMKYIESAYSKSTAAKIAPSDVSTALLQKMVEGGNSPVEKAIEDLDVSKSSDLSTITAFLKFAGVNASKENSINGHYLDPSAISKLNSKVHSAANKLSAESVKSFNDIVSTGLLPGLQAVEAKEIKSAAYKEDSKLSTTDLYTKAKAYEGGIKGYLSDVSQYLDASSANELAGKLLGSEAEQVDVVEVMDYITTTMTGNKEGNETSNALIKKMFSGALTNRFDAVISNLDVNDTNSITKMISFLKVLSANDGQSRSE
ncbi:MAG: hypothetical protein PHE78_08060, partial [Candidatus Gastranaerophilales bacterium]|nr:hypothetical protein [Candidatus Gastranaerophilales bacterium]